MNCENNVPTDYCRDIRGNFWISKNFVPAFVFEQCDLERAYVDYVVFSTCKCLCNNDRQKVILWRSGEN